MVKQLLFACLSVACGGAAVGCSSNYVTANKSQVALHAGILIGPSTVKITNEDTFAWRNVRIELNPVVGIDLTADYSMQVANWPAGTAKKLQLSGFTQGAKHFNPGSAKAKEVVVYCDIPGKESRGYFDGTVEE